MEDRAFFFQKTRSRELSCRHLKFCAVGFLPVSILEKNVCNLFSLMEMFEYP